MFVVGTRRIPGIQQRWHCLLAWAAALPQDLHLSLQLQFTSVWHKTVSHSYKYPNGIWRKESKNRYKVSCHEVLCYCYALPEVVLGWLLCPKKLYQKPGHLFGRMLCECKRNPLIKHLTVVLQMPYSPSAATRDALQYQALQNRPAKFPNLHQEGNALQIAVGVWGLQLCGGPDNICCFRLWKQLLTQSLI